MEDIMEDIQFRNSYGETLKEALEGIVYPPCHNLTAAERDWWMDVANRLDRRVGIRSEQVEKLEKKNEELRKQIPKKPRKCLSQKDKACLRRVRDVLGSFSDDDKASDDPTEDDWYDDETLKLLDRLIK